MTANQVGRLQQFQDKLGYIVPLGEKETHAHDYWYLLISGRYLLNSACKLYTIQNLIFKTASTDMKDNTTKSLIIESRSTMKRGAVPVQQEVADGGRRLAGLWQRTSQ